jgi:ATP-binding cassette subfamily B protein
LGTAWLVALVSTWPGRDETSYWHDLLAGDQARREVRLFGLAGEFLSRFMASWRQLTAVTTRAFQQKARPVYVVAALLVVSYVGSMGWLAHDAWTGAVAVGGLVTVVGALINLSGFGMTGDAGLSAAYCQSIVERLRALHGLTLPDAVVGADAVTPDVRPEPAAVELAGVRYTYPGSECPAVDGVSVMLAPGSTTAIVGVNGSGKSTLMRLIAGIDDPDEGSIAVAGETATRMRHVSAVFQQSAHFPLDVADNIGLGLNDGVAQAAQATGVGTDVLTRHTEPGDDPGLSGGQWQRVALARCLLRASRRGGAVLLDEPTAALDPLQEKALFDDFRTLTHGLTAVLVTHRLGSVVDVDRIVVLDAGQVVADGTHEQLMAQGGLYADLFELQRAALLDPVDGEGDE